MDNSETEAIPMEKMMSVKEAAELWGLTDPIPNVQRWEALAAHQVVGSRAGNAKHGGYL